MSSIISINSPSEQINKFENLFSVALTVIRNVNTLCKTPEETMDSYIDYVISHNLWYHFYNQADFAFVPVIGWDLLSNYAKYGNSLIPPLGLQ